MLACVQPPGNSRRLVRGRDYGFQNLLVSLGYRLLRLCGCSASSERDNNMHNALRHNPLRDYHGSQQLGRGNWGVRPE